ncbi:hypothetical protein O181_060011 [Austropuccinia psidii MF-1]|uniref:VHS domain-containing protein n=1 Tax=Austropuccinia psidii MF-1 TaxID=1389203 RepID=A0A9Q3EK34_9BASI|nr:hypothetical protein [Austropuccinia psidii MF-1]
MNSMLSQHYDLNSTTSQPFQKKRTGFFARLTQHSNSSSSSSNSSQIDKFISHICISDQDFQDWPQIFELTDKISSNQINLKDLLRALKKQIKSSNQTHQIKAIRLTVVLTLNSSDQFRLQISSKKFLETIEDAFHKASKSSNGYPLQDIIVKAFGVLTHQFQHDNNLAGFSNLYNKFKPPSAPSNGFVLDQSDGLFTPASVAPSTTHAQANHPQQSIPHHSQQNPSGLPVMRDVRAEAEIARSNARLLIEALAFTIPSEMESNEIIKEFHGKCLQSQNQLLDDIPWATAQAEQARSRMAATDYQVNSSPRLPRTNPYAPLINSNHHLPPSNPYAPLVNGNMTMSTEPVNPTNDRLTREEQLLEMLLASNSELIDAFRQFDELERLARADKELKLVEELSKNETRHDSNLNGLQEGEGSERPGPSTRTPSPLEKIQLKSTDSKLTSSYDEISSQNNQMSYLPPTSKPTSQPIRGYHVPQSFHNEINFDPIKTSTLDLLDEIKNDKEQGDDGNISIPLEPSEKALGKMRRISGILD